MFFFFFFPSGPFTLSRLAEIFTIKNDLLFAKLSVSPLYSYREVITLYKCSGINSILNVHSYWQTVHLDRFSGAEQFYLNFI